MLREVSRIPTEEMASIVLAKAVADAINPDRPAHTAYIGNALLQPLMVRVISLLADQGYQIERSDPGPAAA